MNSYIRTTLVCAIMSVFLFQQKQHAIKRKKPGQHERAMYVEARARYEFDMLKDPVTGKIPYNIRQQEIQFAKQLPVRENSTLARTHNLNAWFPAGPNNVGGRTRALAYDMRYDGTNNRVILSGSVSGGIMRSTDGGQTWTRTSPDGDIHNLTALAQDPRSGQQNTWYAGGGEVYGNSASSLGPQGEALALYLGFGIWKSTNNGQSWTKLTRTVTDINGNPIAEGTLEQFENPFDFVHNIAVDPTNGNVYIAGHRRLIRSTDGGNSFQVVLTSAITAVSTAGQLDVAVTNTGRVIAAINGGHPDLNFRGVWISSTGNANSYTRIAGGQIAGVDSVNDWRANSYTLLGGGVYDPRRIVMTLAPSNTNIAYFFYENGESNEGSNNAPEADLFKLDMSSGFAWTNLSANMPDFPNGDLVGSDPLTVQGGYDMMVKVKPNDVNAVFIGGTNLYRSTDGFTTTANTDWINGYATNFTYALYSNGHPDQHNLAFNPSNPNEAISADDGGLRITNNIMEDPAVVWLPLPNYQTLQYYHVTMDPDENRNNFAGGAQDNGTRFRDKLGLLIPPVDSNNHAFLISGDGGHVGLSKLTIADQNQYLYASTQYGNIRRVRLTNGVTFTGIRPNGLTPSFPGATSEFGEFVTNFKLNQENTEDLYYVNFNRLFRTTSASSVTAGGWTELTGVGSAISPSNGTSIGIRGIAFTRGSYNANHVMYIGTSNGKIFRLNDPRNAAPGAAPADITPTGLAGNVQDIATNPNNDAEVIAVVSNYNTVSIWHTTNGKSATPTWTNVEGNLTLPSIRSCMIVVKKDAANNPATEYYVGTSVGLYSTTSLSGTVTWVREGGSVLNLAVVQSIAYRPFDNVMVLGTHGNGMYYGYLGTPNFTNVVTGIDPVINDKNFIKQVYPTITNNAEIVYRTGSLLSVKKIDIQLLSINGQELYRRRDNYKDGTVNISQYPSGNYVMVITSEDKKYRHLQQIVIQ